MSTIRVYLVDDHEIVRRGLRALLRRMATSRSSASPLPPDYLLPTSMECPSWQLGGTVTPSPHHPLGAKGVGESATVGSPACVVNAVVDALEPYGVRHIDMPLTPAAVWCATQGRPLLSDLAIT